jgi:hypothetical protein
MKRMFILAAALLAALAISAQEPNKFGLKKPDSPRSGKYELPDSLRNKFELPDSLAHLSPWKPDYRAEGRMKVKPSVTMTSVVVIHKECHCDRQQYIAAGTAFHHLERPGLEQRFLPRCVPRCADDLGATAAVGYCCPVPVGCRSRPGIVLAGLSPLDSVTRKFAGTEYGALRASIRTGA